MVVIQAEADIGTAADLACWPDVELAFEPQAISTTLSHCSLGLLRRSLLVVRTALLLEFWGLAALQALLAVAIDVLRVLPVASIIAAGRLVASLHVFRVGSSPLLVALPLERSVAIRSPSALGLAPSLTLCCSTCLESLVGLAFLAEHPPLHGLAMPAPGCLQSRCEVFI